MKSMYCREEGKSRLHGGFVTCPVKGSYRGLFALVQSGAFFTLRKVSEVCEEGVLRNPLLAHHPRALQTPGGLGSSVPNIPPVRTASKAHRRRQSANPRKGLLPPAALTQYAALFARPPWRAHGAINAPRYVTVFHVTYYCERSESTLHDQDITPGPRPCMPPTTTPTPWRPRRTPRRRGGRRHGTRPRARDR
jgi:hypothetical protein